MTMREIKFRGKRVDNGKWLCGDLHHGMITKNIYIMGTQVIPETVGQYTGLKDRNGVEIYEGDVIQEFAGEHVQGVWEFSNVSVVEDLRCIPESLGFADCTYIIGSIHENPELMGTYTEAIKEINSRIELANRYRSDLILDDTEGLKMAIEALRKQEPVNPVNDHCKCGEDVRNWTGDEPFNYCPNCGQAIDWREDL